MEAFLIGIFILSCAFLITGVVLIKDADKIKIQKTIDEAEIQKTLDEYEHQQDLLKSSINNLEQSKSKIEDDIQNKRDDLKRMYEDYKDFQIELENNKDNDIECCKETARNALSNYIDILDKDYIKVEKEYTNRKLKIETDIDEITAELNKIKNTLAAAQDAQLREQEKKEKLDFYRLLLEQKDTYEIGVISSIESQLADPRPLRMLIWTTYYSKKANDMCSRIIGTTKITGIYKITNIKNNVTYIGQSKDIRERWREHIKCGLGIDTPAGNKLYKAMREDGISSFTFELLEKCKEEQLNEKEKFYIELYNSYNFGYNSNTGIAKK